MARRARLRVTAIACRVCVALAAVVVPAAAAMPMSATGTPTIWFAPLPRDVSNPNGSKDFMQLFSPAARWVRAASHVSVFKLYGGWVARGATDTQLRKAVADIRRRGFRLAFESGPLDPPSTCGNGIEGFPFGSQEGPRIARRIRDAGGRVDLQAMDEPFFYASVYDGTQACHWTAAAVARRTVRFAAAIHRIFPHALVGDIEPLVTGVPAARYEQWIDAYRQAAGHQLPFFHVDVDWARPDWPQAVKELENYCRARGIAFGVIYTGDAVTPSDRAWLSEAEARFTTYEARTGGRPDAAILQSWNAHPVRALPEATPYTFTWLIDRYARTRTRLSLDLTGTSGVYRATGRLLDAGGKPVGGAEVSLTAVPTAGAGLAATYTVQGEVPAEAVKADVGYRVDTECGCDGGADLSLYSVVYTEDSDPSNLVPNPDFSSGTDAWGYWGEASQQVQPSDRGSGSMLHVVAAPGQVAAINSTDFAVSPGRRFTTTFQARVSPASTGHGYFSVVFLSGTQEILRERIPLTPAAVSLGTATTGGDGRYALDVSSLGPGEFRVDAWFAGNAQRFPASAARTP